MKKIKNFFIELKAFAKVEIRAKIRTIFGLLGISIAAVGAFFGFASMIYFAGGFGMIQMHMIWIGITSAFIAISTIVMTFKPVSKYFIKLGNDRAREITDNRHKSATQAKNYQSKKDAKAIIR